MKRGILMEHRRGYSIIMTSDGHFQKAKRIKNTEIGEEVHYETIKLEIISPQFPGSKKRKFTPIRLLVMASILLLCIMPFYFIVGEDKTYAYVNVDINPSIELGIDKGLTVRSITPLNADGIDVVSALTDVKKESLENAIIEIMNKSEEAGLLENGKNMLLGISYATKESQDIQVIDQLQEYFSVEQSDWIITTFKVPKEVRDMANEDSKSMNEVMAQKLIQEDESSVKEDNKVKKINEKEKEIIETFYTNTKDKDIILEQEQEQNEMEKPVEHNITPSISSEEEKHKKSDKKERRENNQNNADQDLKVKENKSNGNKRDEKKSNGENKHKKDGEKKDKQQQNNGKNKQNKDKKHKDKNKVKNNKKSNHKFDNNGKNKDKNNRSD